MKRRDFIKMTAALSAIGALPIWSRIVWGDSVQPALPIPPLLAPNERGEINISAQSGYSAWGKHKINTWGYNGALLGPALILERGKEVSISIHNRLPEATTVHWHGLEVPGTIDGGPQARIEKNANRQVTFTLDQPAATCWFHPHQHGRTGYQVARGLAGLVLINDADSQKLPLPKQWGVDDIPVILQDKRLTPNGRDIDYQLDVMSAAMGWAGDMMLTNGTVYPQHKAPSGWVRLRLLNGCNARSLNIAISDRRPMYVIASDGGFLSEPIKVSELNMLPGERFEVLIETANGQQFEVVTLPVQQMGMMMAPFNRALPVLSILPTHMKSAGTLPDKLATLPSIPSLQDAATSRAFMLTMDPELDRLGMKAMMERYPHAKMSGMDMEDMEMSDMHMDQYKQHTQGKMVMMNDRKMSSQEHFDFYASNKINGAAFNMKHPSFEAKRGAYEKWVISSEGDDMLHPFHIHGTQFRIISENGKPPATHRAGWKDTVSVMGARSEVIVRFDHKADTQHAYMAHCHILEHEDTGMMLGFTVA